MSLEVIERQRFNDDSGLEGTPVLDAQGEMLMLDNAVETSTYGEQGGIVPPWAAQGGSKVDMPTLVLSGAEISGVDDPFKTEAGEDYAAGRLQRGSRDLLMLALIYGVIYYVAMQ